ncbi:TnsA-like heteromeric transposase endonuclease subunit [Streptomyces goshikiensis]|uniref:TnsA-like heteromeric transposase endonuclease subunit n=1 Tax=Streptomyces goshikiensis TaxID=1942 RepID=UPI0036551105
MVVDAWRDASPHCLHQQGVLWTDSVTLAELARTYTLPSRAVASLDRSPGWASRWETVWRFGRTSATYVVRDIADVELESTIPVRRFSWRTGQWHRPGLEYLVSTGRHHGFESFEEELLLLSADFAGDLVEALAQPFRLRFGTASGPVTHTPDFLLLTRRIAWLVDVRPAERIDPLDEVKFAAAAEVALSAGWRYTVVTGWPAGIVDLVDALSAGRRPLTDPLGQQAQLLAAAATAQPFGELVDRCSVPSVARAHAVHLLWHRRLGLPLAEGLRDASLVRLAPGAGRKGGTW